MSVKVINIKNGSVVSKATAIEVNQGDMIEFSNISDGGVSVRFSADTVPLVGFKNPLSLEGKSKASFAVTDASKAGEQFSFSCETGEGSSYEQSSYTTQAKEPDGSIIINDGH